ncbi:hypothetical protein PInf_018416 [Phytophthora infestans]|nr:hypothetical protein PInf_018416 [Phytophthora infestans]
MVSTRSSILFLTSAFALQGHAGATTCDADNYSKVSAAVQTLRTNCAGWAAYLSNGGVWTCDSMCHDAVGNLVSTLPDCTFGGPHGQNYKEVVEEMLETCGDHRVSTSDSTNSSAHTSQENFDTVNCDGDNYSKVSAAVQTLRTNCVSWAAYLSNAGVWTCDSTCHDAVGNLVSTLPDCMFGGPHGQNYKEVVEEMLETCGGQLAPKSDPPTSPSATTAAPSTTTVSPVATTNAPTTSNNTSSTEAASATSPPTSATASSSAETEDTPASEVSTTSGANMQAISSIAAVVMIVSSMVLH